MGPYLDHGYDTPYYGPSGPIGKLARIELNKRAGRPLDDGLGKDPLNSD